MMEIGKKVILQEINKGDDYETVNKRCGVKGT